MSEFKTVLDVRLLPECPDIEQWMLLAPLVYQSDLLDRGIVVPAGFLTDFLSFKSLNFTAHRPTVLHDFLYSCSDIERDVADAVLSEAMGTINADEGLVKAMYEAVRLFGGSHRKPEDLHYDSLEVAYQYERELSERNKEAASGN